MTNNRQIQNDFDLIAAIPNKRWSHNRYYYSRIIASIKGTPSKALDVGCGKGSLANLLTKKCIYVDAIDLSPVMINEATLSFGANKRLNFVCDSIETFWLEENSYDLIVSTDVIHHLDFAWFCNYAKQALKPQGQLIILDFLQSTTLSDRINDACSTLIDILCNLACNHRISEYSKQQRLIWKRHEDNDTFLPLDAIWTLAKEYLPQAMIKRKLFWRYMLVWTKKQ